MAKMMRCPQCGDVAMVEPQAGADLVAVYHLCVPPHDPLSGGRTPVRMEEVSDEDLLPIAAKIRKAEPAGAR